MNVFEEQIANVTTEDGERYVLVHELPCCWQCLDVTVEKGLDELKTRCTNHVVVKGKPRLHNIP